MNVEKSIVYLTQPTLQKYKDHGLIYEDIERVKKREEELRKAGFKTYHASELRDRATGKKLGYGIYSRLCFDPTGFRC